MARGAVAIVATEGMALVGYVLARVIVDEAEILSLATLPNRRRRGVATRLLEAALADFRVRGVHAVWLEVRESNAPAQALYRAHGFVVAGRRRDYYRQPVEDALVLRSELRPDALDGPSMRCFFGRTKWRALSSALAAGSPP